MATIKCVDKEASMAEESSKSRRHRSPSYPSLSLEKALEKLQVLVRHDGRHAAPVDAVYDHWGYTAGSSQGSQAASALRQYGLVAAANAKAGRTLQVTELGWRILHEERDRERRDALQQAAINPKLYAGLWEKWGAQLPSDSTMRSYLTVELSFNPNAVEDAIANYKATLEHSELLRDEATDDEEPDDGDLDDDGADDDDEGVNDEVVKREKQREEVVVRGEEEHLRARLAGGRVARVLFRGPAPTQREITKLIKLLELSLDEYPEAEEE